MQTARSDPEIAKAIQETFRTILERGHGGGARRITPENVYQAGRRENLDLVLSLQDKLLVPGSGFEGLEHMDEALARYKEGKRLILLLEHKGNFDVPAFHFLLRLEEARYRLLLDRLVYVAGRKLNEESEVVRRFTEVFSRLVIVPRREIPASRPGETPEEEAARAEATTEAVRINRAAFRKMFNLIEEGAIIGLFPLGGRPKPNIPPVPVKETTTYLKHFDWMLLVGMEGNTLPVGAGRMEEEIPRRDLVVFRIAPPRPCNGYLEEAKAAYAAAAPADLDFEQFTANRIVEEISRLSLAAGLR